MYDKCGSAAAVVMGRLEGGEPSVSHTGSGREHSHTCMSTLRLSCPGIVHSTIPKAPLPSYFLPSYLSVVLHVYMAPKK